MDKEKIDSIIELLEQIKDHLKDDLPTKVNVKPRFELRYWDNERPKDPDMVSNDFLRIRSELYWKIETYLYAEVLDNESGNIINSYNEEKGNEQRKDD